MNLLPFDIQAYLEDRNILFHTEGKNVTEGWTNITCLWCDDLSNHLGVSPNNLYHCWICGKKGSVLDIIRKIENCSYSKAESIVKEYSTLSPLTFEEKIKEHIGPRRGSILPKEAGELTTLHRDYLQQRNYNPDFLIEKYRLTACDFFGKYKYRIIVPVLMAGKVVNFTARDTTGRAKEPYLNCPNKEALIPMKDCLYNLDSVQDTALIVEGVTDVWTMGDGTVATMGTEFTQNQILLLHQKGIKKAAVMFDGAPVAIAIAHKLANTLSAIIPVVDVLELDSGDPGELSEEDVMDIRKRVFEY